MNELNISSILCEKRREKGVTQEEVAEYIGVSKASVSKWEKGSSYPDITVLPVLATYYNISVDQLLGYRPQLEEKEIWRKYQEFSGKFAEGSFLTVMEETREFIRKYDSCYPLFLAMAQLYLNHSMLAPSKEEGMLILDEAAALCQRIQRESEDTLLKKDALSMEATMALMKREPGRVLELLGTKIRGKLPTELLISSAYTMLGERKRAMEILQGILYQNVLESIDYLGTYFELAQSEEKKEEALLRCYELIDVFSMRSLMPHKAVSVYFAGALYHGGKQDGEKTLKYLEDYVELIEKELPNFTIHGDSFFDSLEDALKMMGVGESLPRDLSLVKNDLFTGFFENPLFEFLKEDPRYQVLEKRMKRCFEKD